VGEKTNSDGTSLIHAATGIVDTVAGSAGDGGPATGARLNYASAVAVDIAGNLYIADTLNYRIRRVDASTGIISPVAGDGVSGFSGDGGRLSQPKSRLRPPSP
jgi:hypothetical protein